MDTGPRSIVGLGASAGGLEALQRFLGADALTAGIALVIVTHRGDNQDSGLDRFLADMTSLPVRPAGDGVLVEADRIYVMPPRSVLTISSGRFLDVTDLARSEARQPVLIDELNHRVRNMLAVVASLAQLSLPGGNSRDRFVRRLVSIGRTYDLLSLRNWQPVALADIAQRELAPFRAADAAVSRVEVTGPPVRMEAESALAMGMIFHELATNATKYGALSLPAGNVALSWSLDTPDGSPQTMVLDWSEKNGPPVAVPKQRGFGRRLIDQQTQHGLGGTAVFDFRPTGLHVRLTVPLGRTVAPGEPDGE